MATPVTKAIPQVHQTGRVRSRSGGDLFSPRALDNTSLILLMRLQMSNTKSVLFRMEFLEKS